jgi:MmyB-like transcription regulator ligand binding domain
LARAARPIGRSRRRAPQRIRPGVQHLLDAMHDVPAFVQNGRLDILAINTLGRALYADLLDASDPQTEPRRLPNFARSTFLDSGTRAVPPLGPHRRRERRAAARGGRPSPR